MSSSITKNVKIDSQKTRALVVGNIHWSHDKIDFIGQSAHAPIFDWMRRPRPQTMDDCLIEAFSCCKQMLSDCEYYSGMSFAVFTNSEKIFITDLDVFRDRNWRYDIFYWLSRLPVYFVFILSENVGKSEQRYNLC